MTSDLEELAALMSGMTASHTRLISLCPSAGQGDCSSYLAGMWKMAGKVALCELWLTRR